MSLWDKFLSALPLVLAFAILVEVGSWLIEWWEFRREQRKRGAGTTTPPQR